jgi:hypothetical protein
MEASRTLHRTGGDSPPKRVAKFPVSEEGLIQRKYYNKEARFSLIILANGNNDRPNYTKLEPHKK